MRRKGLLGRLVVAFFVVSLLLPSGVVYAGVHANWELVYAHEENGNRIYGRFDDLVKAIKRGADVKVAVDFGYGWTTYIADQVGLAKSESLVFLKSHVYQSHLDREGYPVLVEDRRSVLLFRTDGVLDRIKYNASETTILVHDYFSHRMKWFVNE